jgi:hypothetical protein
MLPAVPHHATAQTRRRLRAGHRAEPVACRYHGRHHRVRSFALPLCRSFVRRASPSSGSLSAPTRLHRRRSARTRKYTRGAEPLSSLVLSRVQSSAFSRQGFMGNTHHSKPGMPVLPTCLRRSGPFLLRRRARPRTSSLGRMHARTRLCHRMVLWPCPSHVGRDPVALVRTVLSLPFLSPPWTSGAFLRVVSQPSSSLPSRNSDQRPRLSLPKLNLRVPSSSS